MEATKFYTEKWSTELRLGDVVTGYVTALPHHTEPVKKGKSLVDYNIDVNLSLPPYLVILTPCCSIGERTISVAPLERANRRWNTLFENENYKNDMTLLNFPHSPDEWKELDEEVTITGEKDTFYAYDNLFFYFPTNDDTLLKYEVVIKKNKGELDKFEAGFYVIDFRHISRIKCDCIASEKDERKNFNDLLDKMVSSKILELSVKSRSALRNKLAYYFSRPPDADLRCLE